MREPIEFRRGVAADVPAMHALDLVCFEEAFRFSLRAMRRFALAPQASVWVAERDGVLAGFVIAEAEGDAGYVVTLDVAPAERRAGVAAELMRRAMEGLAAAGVRTMSLHVFAGNSAALRFYEGIGFRQAGKEPGFYGRGLDALVYVRLVETSFPAVPSRLSS